MIRVCFLTSLFLLSLTATWAQSVDLTGKIRVSYNDADVIPNPEYNYYKTSTQKIFLDFEERSVDDYVWDGTTGRLTDPNDGEYVDFTPISDSEGTYIWNGDTNDTGEFVTYDASWDLDYDGTPDGEQIDVGILPKYTHKQLGMASLDTSSFWLSNEGVSSSDLSLEFSAQQIDVIASGSSPWGIVNALWVTNSGEINSLSWENDWTISVIMLNSVNVVDGGTRIDSDGEIDAINQAVMWIDVITTAASSDNDLFTFGITLQDHNGVKRILSESPIDGSEYSIPYSPVEAVHIRLSYDSTAAELTSAYSYDGNEYIDLRTSSVAELPSYINGDPIGVSLGAESDNVAISPGENTFKNFVVISDRDGDGLDDSVETNTGIYVSETDTGTNPNNADSDGDSILDAIEVRQATFGFDPNVSSAARLLEFQQAAAELPGVLTDEQRQGLSLGGVSLTPSAGGGFSFEFMIEESEDLSDWTTVDTITHSLDTSGTKKFIRVRKPE